VSGERERLQLLQAKAAEIVDGLPSWDGESPAVLVTVIDPVTRMRLGHWYVPAAAPEPQPQSRPRLRLVEAS
jgi:hypothetical protein